MALRVAHDTGMLAFFFFLYFSLWLFRSCSLSLSLSVSLCSLSMSLCAYACCMHAKTHKHRNIFVYMSRSLFSRSLFFCLSPGLSFSPLSLSMSLSLSHSLWLCFPNLLFSFFLTTALSLSLQLSLSPPLFSLLSSPPLYGSHPLTVFFSIPFFPSLSFALFLSINVQISHHRRLTLVFLVQNDLVHGWGIDFALGKCVDVRVTTNFFSLTTPFSCLPDLI